jgi:hypothetical protein
MRGVSTIGGLTLACLSGPGLSQESGILSRGFGNDSCGKYLAATEGRGPSMSYTLQNPLGEFTDRSALYYQWIQGFLTGINITNWGKAPQMNVDMEGVDLWIRKYCRENPTDNITLAVKAFVREHLRK